MLPTISETALRSLNDAGRQVQNALLEQEGEGYDILDINGALSKWLESSIESLCEDACSFCVTGDRIYTSFNREVFKSLLADVSPINLWDQASEAVQESKDQASLSLDRAA